MFNLKKTKEAQVPYEKYLRQEDIGPKADDNQAIWDKELPHRTGDQYVTTEKQMQDEKKHLAESDDSQIIEKVLNEAKSYVVHRSDKWQLPVPPMSVLVEKLRQDRVAKDYKTEKSDHWSITFDEKKQFAQLPKWPKNAPQHDEITLNNDPRRFSNTDSLPINEEQSKNDSTHSSNVDIKPLVGNITKADVNRVAELIKTGQSIDYDTAIVAILRETEKEKRELTPVERKAISEIKIARTAAMLSQPQTTEIV